MQISKLLRLSVFWSLISCAFISAQAAEAATSSFICVATETSAGIPPDHVTLVFTVQPKLTAPTSVTIDLSTPQYPGEPTNTYAFKFGKGGKDSLVTFDTVAPKHISYGNGKYSLKKKGSKTTINFDTIKRHVDGVQSVEFKGSFIISAGSLKSSYKIILAYSGGKPLITKIACTAAPGSA